MIKYLIKLPFLKRLIPSISRRYYKFTKTNRKYYKIGNINYYLDFLDPMDRLIILNKNYEHDQVTFFEQKLRELPFSYFFDVGANSGYYSFYLADKFKNLKIKSFEINYDAYSKFIKTLENRQGIKISCPEEIAWRNGWITDEKLFYLANQLLKSGYGSYLLTLLEK